MKQQRSARFFRKRQKVRQIDSGPQPSTALASNAASGDKSSSEIKATQLKTAAFSAAVLRRSGDCGAAGQAQLQVSLLARIHRHQREHGQDLHDGQRGRQRQVENVDGLIINLHFQRGEANAAQDQHHAEAGEAEDKNQYARRKQRRADQRQADIAPDRPGARSQTARRFFCGESHRGPIARHDAQGDGEIVKDMRDEDDSQRAFQLDGRIIQRKQRAQQIVNDAVFACQSGECQRDHDCRQHKWQRGQREQQRLARQIGSGRKTNAQGVAKSSVRAVDKAA